MADQGQLAKAIVEQIAQRLQTLDTKVNYLLASRFSEKDGFGLSDAEFVAKYGTPEQKQQVIKRRTFADSQMPAALKKSGGKTRRRKLTRSMRSKTQ